MDTSINNTSGGKAAEIPNINSNQQPNPDSKMNTNDDPILLKEAAARYDCAASSLKNNIKSGKLAGTQTGEKAPYMVRPSDVERFLRDTPGIASILHPAAGKPAPAADPPASAAMPAVSAAQDAESQRAKATGDDRLPPAPATAVAETNPNHGPPACVPDHQAIPSTQTTAGGIKRPRRRRGKGGGGAAIATGNQQPVLKSLAGTTPQERLRLTACLTELLGLVASA